MRIEADGDDESVTIVLSESTPIDEGDTYGGTYTVKLSHQPSQNVTVTVSGQAGTDLTLTGLSSANALTFTSENWNTAQQVTVIATQDDDAADDLVTLVHTGSGGAYAGVSADLAVSVYDNDKAFIVLGEPSLAVEEGDETGQTYPVALSHVPSQSVTVTVSGHDGTDLTLTGPSASNTLTFSITTWSTPQTVTVTAGQDSDTVNDVVTLTHAARGGEYAGVLADMAVRVDDDDGDDVGNAPVENTVATGRPTISGTPAAEETLTADASDIEDVNGMTSATFAYQWVRDTGSSDTDIPGATGAAYAVSEADASYEIKVRVSFTDDAGFEEAVTSNTVYVQPPQPLYGGFDAGTVPTEHGGSGTTFTLELYFNQEPSLTPASVKDHVLTVTNGEVTAAARKTAGSNIRWVITLEPSGDDAVTVLLPLTSDCADQGAVCTQAAQMLSNSDTVTISGPPGTQHGEDDTPVNTAATGKPAVTGTPATGNTLSVDLSAVSDQNGLENAVYTYQWKRGNTAIAGATNSSYTVAETDAGSDIKVTVSFTDDDGYAESVTSLPVSVPLPPLTARLVRHSRTPASHDGSTEFTVQLDLSEQFPISYRTINDHALEVTGGAVTRTARLNRNAQDRDRRWVITIAPIGDAGVQIAVRSTTAACTTTGAICTADGRKLSSNSTMTIAGP